MFCLIDGVMWLLYFPEESIFFLGGKKNSFNLSRSKCVQPITGRRLRAYGCGRGRTARPQWVDLTGILTPSQMLLFFILFKCTSSTVTRNNTVRCFILLCFEPAEARLAVACL